MAIVGPLPETGSRIDLMRPARGGPPWRYAGRVATSEGTFPIAARVSEHGDVSVEPSPAVPEGVARKAVLLLRAAYKHASGDGSPPPRRILRWRA
jgi:hypothetical protein